MIETTMTNGTRAARRAVRLLLLGMLVAIAGTLTVSAWAQPAARDAGAGMGHDMGPRSMAHAMGHGMMFGAAPARIDRRVDRMLDGVGASDAQRSQIKQIAHAAAADLKAQREAARGLRERGLQLLAAPTLDASAIEALRQQMLARHDQASQRVMQALLDASRVLSPEQRGKVVERMQLHRAAMRDRMQRMQHERPAR